MGESLKDKTAKGLLWGGISNGAQQLLNLLFGIFLARLLTPDDYGMVGMLTIFSLIAGSIQESGFITALILKALYPNTKLYVFGTVYEKLGYFTFADGAYHVDHVPEGLKIDHAFECVGGEGSRFAVNQIIDLINPEGSIGLMGVSERYVDINTRDVLEKENPDYIADNVAQLSEYILSNI